MTPPDRRQSSLPTRSRRSLAVSTYSVALVGLVLLVGVVVALSIAPVGGASASTGAGQPTPAVQESESDDETVYVSEEAVVEPVPEEGDLYFEQADPDGEWVSYVNPRDEYRMPYLGDGSGKMCVTLLNEAGQPVEGSSVPGTTVTVPTGDSLSWHDDIDPFVVDYPLSENYNRPLDSDQFGTTADLPQGDGYLDSHCFEWHGLPEDETVEYGEAQIEGPHTDQIDLVGYIERPHEAWDTDIDPLESAVSYEEAGGGWTYHPDGSHGQLVVVLQLDGDADIPVDPDEEIGDEAADVGGDAASDAGGDTDENTDDRGDDSTDDDTGASNGTDDDATDTVPGFGVLSVLAALGALLIATLRRP
ncbi:PGF-CTERM sorting domain-containing protein [Natrialba sp. SSL1]|uniref:PGF-CTERM sorting domain-containing protein n=1 Tax=Natrialba sp. SSL1 TaxID=1869245 RepID=UPI0008F84044|nr:PGF-CTERM sorting domain-containing protein [Natrialba sp. SSL1]OIB56848.1 PGF-CTERM sorting domain-containing protein [Natrialba sp. SSL1]